MPILLLSEPLFVVHKENSVKGIMGSLLGIFSAFLIISMASVEAARQFKVGDNLGWQQPPLNNTEFYTQWAENNRFQVGDSLAFEYQNDSVLQVEKWDYYHCDGSDPITAFDNGKSIIHLETSGPFFFISGTPNHCINGQRLIVDVMSPHPISASPPSIPSSASAPSPQQEEDSSESQLGPSPSSRMSSRVSASGILSSDFMAGLVTFVVVMMVLES